MKFSAPLVGPEGFEDWASEVEDETLGAMEEWMSDMDRTLQNNIIWEIQHKVAISCKKGTKR